MSQLITSQITGSNNRPMLVDLRYDAKRKPSPVVIFIHGFKGFKDWGHFPLVAEAFAQAGFAFISFNFTHNGTTIDNPTAFDDLKAFGMNNYNKELFDTQQILESIANGILFPDVEFDRQQLYLLGHSRGGGIAITKAAESSLVKAVTTWNSIANMHRSSVNVEEWKKQGVVYVPNARTNQQMPMYYQFVEDYLTHEHRYNLKQNCSKLNIPTLFVHGKADTTVPYTEAEKLHQWTKNARLVLIEDANHTLGGKHPNEFSHLPEHTQHAVAETVSHFRGVQNQTEIG